MKPYWESPNEETNLRIYQGHVLDVLREMPAESVHCVVTSPPYWGLRDYKLEPQVWGRDVKCQHEFGDELSQIHRKESPGVRAKQEIHASNGRICYRCGAWLGSLGLEPHPDLYVQHLVEVFREVRRVLRRDGTLWLNMGDSYASNPSNRNKVGGFQANPSAERLAAESDMAVLKREPGIKPKDLLMIPARVALALQADGWWLRSAITWCKTVPMPESVTDRPTSATEMVFLLAKSERYFFDQQAVRESAATSSLRRIAQPGFWEQGGGEKDYGKGQNPSRSVRKALENFALNPGRNVRNWWVINPEPFLEAHFATFPQKLVEPCIMAGTSEKGYCPKCGLPWKRVAETKRTFESGSGRSGNMPVGEYGPDLQSGGGTLDVRRGPTLHIQTVGWQPTCTHSLPPVPATVLDPFLGSGTTLLVAQRLGRNGIGIDLSANYCQMAVRRIEAGHSQIRLGVR